MLSLSILSCLCPSLSLYLSSLILSLSHTHTRTVSFFSCTPSLSFTSPPPSLCLSRLHSRSRSRSLSLSAFFSSSFSIALCCTLAQREFPNRQHALYKLFQYVYNCPDLPEEIMPKAEQQTIRDFVKLCAEHDAAFVFALRPSAAALLAAVSAASFDEHEQLSVDLKSKELVTKPQGALFRALTHFRPLCFGPPADQQARAAGLHTDRMIDATRALFGLTATAYAAVDEPFAEEFQEFVLRRRIALFLVASLPGSTDKSAADILGQLDCLNLANANLPPELNLSGQQFVDSFAVFFGMPLPLGLLRRLSNVTSPDFFASFRVSAKSSAGVPIGWNESSVIPPSFVLAGTFVRVLPLLKARVNAIKEAVLHGRGVASDPRVDEMCAGLVATVTYATKVR